VVFWLGKYKMATLLFILVQMAMLDKYKMVSEVSVLTSLVTLAVSWVGEPRPELDMAAFRGSRWLG
jgi:hypothetical protein